MTDREDDKPARRYERTDGRPSGSSPEHGGTGAEPVHGPDNDPTIPPGYDRAPA